MALLFAKNILKISFVLFLIIYPSYSKVSPGIDYVNNVLTIQNKVIGEARKEIQNKKKDTGKINQRFDEDKIHIMPDFIEAICTGHNQKYFKELKGIAGVATDNDIKTIEDMCKELDKTDPEVNPYYYIDKYKDTNHFGNAEKLREIFQKIDKAKLSKDGIKPSDDITEFKNGQKFYSKDYNLALSTLGEGYNRQNRVYDPSLKRTVKNHVCLTVLVNPSSYNEYVFLIQDDPNEGERKINIDDYTSLIVSNHLKLRINDMINLSYLKSISGYGLSALQTILSVFETHAKLYPNAKYFYLTDSHNINNLTNVALYQKLGFVNTNFKESYSGEDVRRKLLRLRKLSDLENKEHSKYGKKTFERKNSISNYTYNQNSSIDERPFIDNLHEFYSN